LEIPFLFLLSFFSASVDLLSLQLQLLNLVGEVWSRSPPHLVYAMDRLVRVELVDTFSAVNWVFSQEDSPSFGKAHLWEILRNVINMTLSRLSRVEEEAERVAAKLKSSRHGDGEGDVTSEDLMKLEEAHEQQQRAVEEAKQKKNQLFLIIFQRFSISISNLLLKMEALSDPQTSLIREYEFSVVTGHLLAVGRRYSRHLHPIMDTLSQNLFTDEVDERILRIFQRFRVHVEAQSPGRKGSE
jgi:hypothetical protein